MRKRRFLSPPKGGLTPPDPNWVREHLLSEQHRKAVHPTTLVKKEEISMAIKEPSAAKQQRHRDAAAGAAKASVMNLIHDTLKDGFAHEEIRGAQARIYQVIESHLGSPWSAHNVEAWEMQATMGVTMAITSVAEERDAAHDKCAIPGLTDTIGRLILETVARHQGLTIEQLAPSAPEAVVDQEIHAVKIEPTITLIESDSGNNADQEIITHVKEEIMTNNTTNNTTNTVADAGAAPVNAAAQAAPAAPAAPVANAVTGKVLKVAKWAAAAAAAAGVGYYAYRRFTSGHAPAAEEVSTAAAAAASFFGGN